jgi:hypothetical protein
VVVVIGNATLLGIGYIAQGRFRAAAIAVIGAAALLAAMSRDPEARHWPILLGLWWAAIVLNSFWYWHEQEFVDPAHRPKGFWAIRSVVLAIAAFMLVAVLLVRTDAARILEEASDAHREGDCAQARATLDEIDAAHRIVNNGVAVEAQAQVEACELLVDIDSVSAVQQEHISTIKEYLDHPGALWEAVGIRRAELLMEVALTDGSLALKAEAAFQQLDRTLGDEPSLEEEAAELLASFLTGLDMDLSSCDMMAVNEWAAAQKSEQEALNAASATAAAQVPTLMVDCARDTVAVSLDDGIEQYQRFLEAYPDHELAALAQEELSAAETARAQAQEHEEVYAHLTTGVYCDDPIAMPQAGSYDGVEHGSVWLIGREEVREAFMAELHPGSEADATAVVCVSGPEYGSLLQTCHYFGGIGGGGQVDLYANEFQIEVFALRTGERVESYSVEIGGTCPGSIDYTYDFTDSTSTFPESIAAPYDARDLTPLFERLFE